MRMRHQQTPSNSDNQTAEPAIQSISPLRRRMIDDMTIRNMSPTTQRSYLHAVKGYSVYFGCSPERLGLEDVRAYQVHLISKGIAWATLNQIVCALRFFYGITPINSGKATPFDLTIYTTQVRPIRGRPSERAFVSQL